MLYLQGVGQVAEIPDLGTKEEVAELGEGKEDDEEHDEETDDVFLGLSQGASQLSHSLVEAHVLEHL